MDQPRPPGASFPAPRRVFTAPVPTTNTAPQVSSTSSNRNSDGLVETLYVHPSVKIVAFTAGPRPVPLARGITSQPEIEPGSLSWSSQLERTIAVGPFRIFRAPGSVAFLNCGSALQPILPKSQCWCVDEESSKYVLQIRRPQYWRIELPSSDAEDTRRAQLLRDVMDTILQFEKTECPFKRTFTVELPERPKTPVKKRPWTPIRRSVGSLPPTPTTPIEARSLPKTLEEPAGTPVKKNANQSVVSTETVADTMTDKDASLAQEAPTLEVAALATQEIVLEPGTEPEDSVAEELLPVKTIAEPSPSVEVLADSYEKMTVKNPASIKLGSFQATRSATAPPQLTLFTSPSKPVSRESSQSSSDESGEHSQSPTPSQESFHSVRSWHSPSPSLPPSPPLSNPDSSLAFPYPHDNILRLNNKALLKSDSANLTSTPNTPQTWIRSSTEPTTPLPTDIPPAPSLIDDVEISSEGTVATADEEGPGTPPSLEAEVEAISPSSATSEASGASEAPEASKASSTAVTRRPQIRHRATTSSSISPSRRALSPLPPAATLFNPRSARSIVPRGKLAVVRRLPMQVIQKTCEILLSPPSHLINIMLKVAARIAAGEWRGFMLGTGDSGERIPVQWDWSDGDDDGDGELDGWAADDDWPHQGMGPKMAGSFPEDEDEPVNGVPGPSDDNTTDADWSRSWEVD